MGGRLTGHDKSGTQNHKLKHKEFNHKQDASSPMDPGYLNYLEIGDSLADGSKLGGGKMVIYHMVKTTNPTNMG